MSIIFSGSAALTLSAKVSKHSGIPLGQVEIKKFPDKEINIRVREEVRGQEVVVIQNCTGCPNSYLMELFLLIDALKRAGARSILTVLPYFPYCRQDRVAYSGQPISARLVASLLERAGASKMISVDLHKGQLEGFFDRPFLQLIGRKLLIETLKKHPFEKPLFVAPDVGSIKIARAYAKDFGTDFAVIDKHRHHTGEIEMRPIGEFNGAEVILVDDVCSTGSTLVQAAILCEKKGAKKITAAVTHALLVDDAEDQILTSPIETFYYTDTVPVKEELNLHDKFISVDIAPLIAEGIAAMVS